LNTKKHLEEVIKDRDACSAKTLELGKDRDLWKGRCNQMVASIMPVLDLIDPELLVPEARAQPLGVLDKCQRALGLGLDKKLVKLARWLGTKVL
jgi:hypothetical protein